MHVSFAYHTVGQLENFLSQITLKIDASLKLFVKESPHLV